MSYNFILPDIEELLIGFLKYEPEVEALVGGRIWAGVQPREPVMPFIRINRIGGSPEESPHWIDHPRVQVSCYAERRREAKHISSVVRALIATSIIGGHPEGVVTEARLGLERYVPDDSQKPVVACYLGEVWFTTHPLREAVS